MPELAEIRAGIAANLAALKGIQVSAYMLHSPTPPSVHVFPAEVEYDQAMQRGLDKWTLTVQAFVGLVSDVGAQKLLDKYLAPSGAQSVKAVIEADRTLGGAVHDLRVTRSGGYQSFLLEGRGPILAADWSIEVYAAGA
jgi:hypothetical protein